MIRAHHLPLVGLALLSVAAARAADSAPDNDLHISAYLTGLSVHDFDAMTKWYVEKLGFRITAEGPLNTPGGKMRFLEAGTQRIEMMYSPESKPGPARALPPGHPLINGFTHMTLQVPDIEAAKTRLAARGVSPAVGPLLFPGPNVKVMFIRDPEGNMIEFIQMLAK